MLFPQEHMETVVCEAPLDTAGIDRDSSPCIVDSSAKFSDPTQTLSPPKLFSSPILRAFAVGSSPSFVTSGNMNEELNYEGESDDTEGSRLCARVVKL